MPFEPPHLRGRPFLRVLHCLVASWCVGAAAAEPVTVVRAARLYDGKSETVVAPGIVVVAKGTILAAGPRAEIPGGARVIDLGDATLLPGLIDVGLRNAIDAGKVPGPRMRVSVYAIGARGGHCDPTGGFRPELFREPGTDQGVANGADQIRAAVRFNAKHGADVIKTCATGGVLSEADKVDSPQLTQAELDALVDEAHALGRKTAAHAHGAEGAKRAIRAGIDSIEHGSFLDDEAFELMRKKGIFFVMKGGAVVRNDRDAPAKGGVGSSASVN